MIFRIIILINLLFLVISCGGGGSSSGSSSEEGISIEVTASHYPRDNNVISSTTSKSFTNTEGVMIELSTAYLVIWSVEFTTNCSDISFAKLLDILIPAAYAHSDENPLLMNVPNVIDIIAEDYTEIYLGDANPPPGNYCGAEIQLLKADEDTVNLPEAIDMVNRLLYIEGNYRLTNESEAIDFTIDISAAALPKSLLLNPDIIVSKSNKTGQLALGLYYDRWFDAIDMSSIEFDTTQQNLLLNNITNSLH